MKINKKNKKELKQGTDKVKKNTREKKKQFR
jgi:hypothetical protein